MSRSQPSPSDDERSLITEPSPKKTKRDVSTAPYAYDSSQEASIRNLKNVAGMDARIDAFAGYAAPWSRGDVEEAAKRCLDSGVSADDVYTTITDTTCDFKVEFMSHAMGTLVKGGLSADRALWPVLQVEYPELEKIREVVAADPKPSPDLLTKAMAYVMKSLVLGKDSSMFPSCDANPFHDVDAGSDDGTMNIERLDFCFEAYKLMVDAGGRPAQGTINLIEAGRQKWEVFKMKPPRTNCYGTPWDKDVIDDTCQALWELQHYPSKAPKNRPPPPTGAASSQTKSPHTKSSSRICLDCPNVLPPSEPKWKSRCLQCCIKKKNAADSNSRAKSDAAHKKFRERMCLDCSTKIGEDQPEWKVRCLACWKKNRR